MLQKLSLALLGTTVLVMSANPASAVTMTVNSGMFSTYSNTQVVTFDNGTANDPNGFATYSGITTNIVQGSVSGQYASPAGNTTKYLTIAPTNTRVAGNTGAVTIDFKKAIDYFGFYAGSLDTYNVIEIFNGSERLNRFTGSDVPKATANGDQTSGKSNLFINLIAESGQTFNRVVLSSNGIAFETDNHTYRVANQSIPEPNAMLGLLAIGAFGVNSVFKRLDNKTVKG